MSRARCPRSPSCADVLSHTGKAVTYQAPRGACHNCFSSVLWRTQQQPEAGARLILSLTFYKCQTSDVALVSGKCSCELVTVKGSSSSGCSSWTTAAGPSPGLPSWAPGSILPRSLAAFSAHPKDLASQPLRPEEPTTPTHLVFLTREELKAKIGALPAPGRAAVQMRRPASGLCSYHQAFLPPLNTGGHGCVWGMLAWLTLARRRHCAHPIPAPHPVTPCWYLDTSGV